MGPGSALTVEKGQVHLLFAYDIGLSIDLERCKQHITSLTEQARIKHKGHAPAYFQFDPPPLRVTQDVVPLVLGRHKSSSSADIVLYDFGGVSVAYSIPFEGPFEELIELSCELAQTTLFWDDSRKRVEQLSKVIEAYVSRANVDPLSEDYLIFQIDAFTGGLGVEELCSRHGAAIARLLRSEPDPLSDQETGDALATRVSFGASDVALIDWNAALLYDREPEDVRAVLEFANLQLLEMRFLDAGLDRALDRSYEMIGQTQRWPGLRLPRAARRELRRVAQMQVDGAILFERVNNAIKLLGDQYLARVYRATLQRYRLPEWNSGILRKLETIESIYQKVHDQASGLRMEMLEWIIIGLIAFEIVLSLLSK
jgi:hypothetical protein